MKREKWLNCLNAAVLAWMLSFGGIGSFVDGFQLETPGLGWLALVCAGTAICCAAAFRFRYGGLVVAGGVTALLIMIWEQAQLQCKMLIWLVSANYRTAYGWPEIRFGLDSYSGVVFSYPLVLLAVLIAVCVTWTVCRRRWSGPAVIVGLLPLAASLLLQNTMPDTKLCLFLLLLGEMLLMLTGTVRRASERQGNRLTAVAILPAALLLALLFRAAPLESYTNNAKQLRSQLYGWAQQLALDETDISGLINATLDGLNQEKVNLEAVGPKVRQTYKVMEVTAPVSKLLYLRGQDYDVYDGAQWRATEDRTEDFGILDSESLGMVQIVTAEQASVYYLPYFPKGTVTLTGGCIPNEDRKKAYSFELTEYPNMSLVCSFIDHSGKTQTLYFPSVSETLNEQYCSLPENTRLWAQEEVLPQFDFDGLLPSEQAELIAQFVRESALYSLDTSRMPSDETDFVRWFVEDSDTGYCVHFASTTTVLLRAAGIPARFVEGYTVQAEAGVPVVVTQDMAHSWAEYYDAAMGHWVVLESTPMDLSVFAPEEVQQTDEAARPQEQPTTEPERTLPDEKTNPPRSEPDSVELDWLWVLLKWLSVIAAGIVLTIGQRQLRLQLRRRKLEKAQPNGKALLLWHGAAHLARSLGEQPPKQLHELAQKAKFSQHTLTEDELSQFAEYLRAGVQTMRQRPWYRRVLDMFLFAYY